MIELSKYKALTPDSYGFMNYSLSEIFSNIKILESNAERMWDVIKEVFGSTFFHTQIQAEYSQLFSHKDQELLKSEIGKINDEAARNLTNVSEKCEQEIIYMRRLINNKEVEMSQLKADHKNQLDMYKVIYKESGYREAEQVHQEKATR